MKERREAEAFVKENWTEPRRSWRDEIAAVNGLAGPASSVPGSKVAANQGHPVFQGEAGPRGTEGGEVAGNGMTDLWVLLYQFGPKSPGAAFTSSLQTANCRVGAKTERAETLKKKSLSRDTPDSSRIN